MRFSFVVFALWGNAVSRFFWGVRSVCSFYAMDEQEKNPPSVYDYVAAAIQQMAQVSWQKLGLQPDTISGKLEQNLSEAKVAIDVVAHLTGVLEPQLDDADKRQVQGLLRDLRMNFIHKSTEKGTEAEA